MSLIPFDFDGLAIRVVMRDGDPWFVASDVCKALEIADGRQAVDRLDDDERGGCAVPTPGGTQTVRCVSESGLYSLTMTSRKPEAKRFKSWITREVLPSIRKTGSFGTTDVRTALSDPATLRALLSDYAERVETLTAEVAAKSEALAIAQPKAAAYDRFLDADGLCGLQNAGRALNVGPNIFIAALRSAGILTTQGRATIAYSEYVNRGYFEHRPVVFFNHKLGKDEQTLQAKFTTDGLAWIERKIAKGEIVVRGVA